MPLTFDEATHVYLLDGVRLPSVTTIISGVLGNPFPDTPAVRAAMERGTEVHRTIALDFAGDLDESTVDPIVLPYLVGARLFCREMNFKPNLVEKYAASKHGFAGMVDAISTGALTGTLIDWKTSAAERPEVRFQTAAYSILAEELGFKITTRMAVRLTPEGSYKCDVHKNHARDRAEFLTLLAAFKIKESLK